MKPWRILAALALIVIPVPSLHAQELRFFGRDAHDRQKGWIEMHGQYYHVAVGTLITGWGVVTELNDSHLITQHTLTDGEKDALRRQGAAVYDAIQIKIPHESLRVVPVLK